MLGVVPNESSQSSRQQVGRERFEQNRVRARDEQRRYLLRRAARHQDGNLETVRIRGATAGLRIDVRSVGVDERDCRSMSLDQRRDLGAGACGRSREAEVGERIGVAIADREQHGRCIGLGHVRRFGE